METKFLDSYMKVEDVLRYIKRNALAAPQYKIGELPCNFFKCSDLKENKFVGPRLFRMMECEVVTHMVVSKEKNEFFATNYAK